MKNYVEFKLNGEQTEAAKRIINAIKKFNDSLSSNFLCGYVSYETQRDANLFFTLDAAESILYKGKLWRNQCKAAAKELQNLDYICENNPEAIDVVKEEIKNLHDAFASCKDIMMLID